MDSKVSIIIPTYNDSATLKDCVKSLIGQSYTNLEIIIINDGSTDNTIEVCDVLAMCDPRIRVINQKHSGIGAVRNLGLSVATGEFVEFIDSDDWIAANSVELMTEKQQESQSDIVICNRLFFLQNDDKFVYGDEGPAAEEYTPEQWFKRQFDNKDLINRYWSSSVGKLFRKSLFNRVLFPDSSLSEDDFTIWRVYLGASKICFLNKLLYIVRHWDSSTTAKLDHEQLLPLAPLKEELAFISMLGFDTTAQKGAYLYRLKVNLQYAAQKGDFYTSNTLKRELELLKQYGVIDNS